MNTINKYERYERQIILKEFGLIGQQKLLAAKVLVIGAGGLGCPVIQYLTAAGVGKIGIADDDIIGLNNLHRQVLYTVDDIGKSKAIIAKEKLQKLNPEIELIAINERITVLNALELISAYDLIVDGTDNFATRYLINDACVLMKKPFIFGAISKFEGQVAIFNCVQLDHVTPVNYRDLFAQPPKDGEVLNCAEAGVLGILPGIIGTMMANEVIKLITGMGTPLINKMLTFNALTNVSFEFKLNAKPETIKLIPASVDAFKQLNYDWLCAADNALEIEINKFKTLVDANNTEIIDVREMDELPIITEFKHKKIPLGQLNNYHLNKQVGSIVVICQSGKRSLIAAKKLNELYGDTTEIYSLKGGIVAWNKMVEKL